MGSTGKFRNLKSGFSVDCQNFRKTYPEILGEIIPAWAMKGLHYAGQLLMRDAKMVQPFTPHAWGGLWNSETVNAAVKKNGAWQLECGYNIAYAAKLHEAPDGWNWQLKGSGPKYLETKMALYRNRYMGAVADVIRFKRVPMAA
jgi:hypothetical protein